VNLQILKYTSILVLDEKKGIQSSQMVVSSEGVFILDLNNGFTTGDLRLFTLDLQQMNRIPLFSAYTLRGLYLKNTYVNVLSSTEILSLVYNKVNDKWQPRFQTRKHWKKARIGAMIEGKHVVFGIDFSIEHKNCTPFQVTRLVSDLRETEVVNYGYKSNESFLLSRSIHKAHGYCESLLKVEFHNRILYTGCKHHLLVYY
jgi:hypothetical protein